MSKRKSTRYEITQEKTENNKKRSKKVHSTKSLVEVRVSEAHYPNSDNIYEDSTVEQLPNSLLSLVTSDLVSDFETNETSVDSTSSLLEKIPNSTQDEPSPFKVGLFVDSDIEVEAEETLTQDIQPVYSNPNLTVSDTIPQEYYTQNHPTYFRSPRLSGDENSYSYDAPQSNSESATDEEGANLLEPNVEYTTGRRKVRNQGMHRYHGGITSPENTLGGYVIDSEAEEAQSSTENEGEPSEEERNPSSSPELHTSYNMGYSNDKGDYDTLVQETNSPLLSNHSEESQSEETIEETVLEAFQNSSDGSLSDSELRDASPPLSARISNDNSFSPLPHSRLSTIIPESIQESQRSDSEDDESSSVVFESEAEATHTPVHSHQRDFQETESSDVESGSRSDDEQMNSVPRMNTYKPSRYNATKERSVPSVPFPLPYRSILSQSSPSVRTPIRSRPHNVGKRSKLEQLNLNLSKDNKKQDMVDADLVENSQSEDSNSEDFQSSQATSNLVNRSVTFSDQVEDTDSDVAEEEPYQSAIMSDFDDIGSWPLDLNFSSPPTYKSNDNNAKRHSSSSSLSKSLKTRKTSHNKSQKSSHRGSVERKKKHGSSGDTSKKPHRDSANSKTLQGVFDKKKRIDGTFYLVQFRTKPDPEWASLAQLLPFQQDIDEYEATTREYFRELSQLETEAGLEDDTESEAEEPFNINYSVLSR